MSLSTEKKLRPQIAQLACNLLAQLISFGLVYPEEYAIIKRNLNHLAKNGELPPAVPHKLITPQEASELLGISYSQFRQLEKEGAFEGHFKRRMVGNKTVRYYLPDIVAYMQMEEKEV